tara:strand:+ start:10448 stop:10999 length:552 start_codon:yes stop_codon:yes gene_type:complete
MKLAIVGQPNLGKTTLVHILQFQYPEEVTLVPDKFEIIKKESIPETKNMDAFKHYQRALFFFQKELEEIVSLGSDGKIVICDGSTLDVFRYWPESVESFFDNIHSTLKTETERYDWVLELLSPTDDAIKTNIWIRHPRYISLKMEKEFNFTAKKMANIIRQIMDNTPYRQILNSLTESTRVEL